MATRMQQRRGTAAQWTSSNPTLAAGEIGFETDTNKFKVGNGTSAWASLNYFVDGSVALDTSEVGSLIDAAVADLVGNAPNALNTIWELANAIDGDANFAYTVTTTVGGLNNSISLINAELEGIQNSIVDLGYSIGNTTADLGDLSSNTTSNISSALNQAAEYTSNTVTEHNSFTTNVHGIANTEVLATVSDVSTAKSEAITDSGLAADSKISNAVSALTKSSVGLSNVDNTSDADKPVSTAAQTALDLKANIDGQTFTGNVVLPSTTSVGDVSSTEIGYVNGVTSAIQTQIDSKAPLANPTFTGQVNVNDLEISGALTFSGTATEISQNNLTISDPLIYLGDGNTANINDLGFVANYNDGTYKHTGLARDASAGKWKLFTDVADEPTNTINFEQGSLDALEVGAFTATSIAVGNVSNTEIGYLDGVTSAIQTQLDAKAPSSSPTLATPTITGALTLSSSGVVFTDGTQTHEGVPSRTPIAQKSASYTLSELSERDSLIEISSGSGVTITIPTNSAVAYPVGTSIDILQTNTGQVTIAGDTGVTVNGTPGLKLRTQWSSATLFKRASDVWVVMGDLSA